MLLQIFGILLDLKEAIDQAKNKLFVKSVSYVGKFTGSKLLEPVTLFVDNINTKLFYGLADKEIEIKEKIKEVEERGINFEEIFRISQGGDYREYIQRNYRGFDDKGIIDIIEWLLSKLLDLIKKLKKEFSEVSIGYASQYDDVEVISEDFVNIN